MTAEPYFEDVPMEAYEEAKPRRAQSSPTDTELKPSQFDADTVIGEMEVFRKHGPGVMGERTGVPSFDVVMGRYMRPGSVVVLAGGTSAGKTVLAGQVALHTGERGGGVLFWSLEMTQAELAKRMAANTLRLPLPDIEMGLRNTKEEPNKYSEEDWERAKAEIRRLSQLPIDVEGSGEGSLDDVEKAIVEYKKEHGSLRLVVVDYIQILDPLPGSERSSERMQLVANTRKAKRIAMKHKVCVVLVSQLNRSMEETAPKLHNLHGSSSIEKDANLVVFVHGNKDGLGAETEEALDRAREAADLAPFGASDDARIVYAAKNRNGPKMAAWVEFHGEQMRFADPGEPLMTPYVPPAGYTDREKEARAELEDLL